jgi:hypothetical protein
VKRKQAGPIPEAIAQLQREFDQFRSTQARRTKLPEPLWQAAVKNWPGSMAYMLLRTCCGWTILHCQKSQSFSESLRRLDWRSGSKSGVFQDMV